MPQVMVIPVVALCIACYTGQSFFNKLFSMRYQGPPAAATPAYATLFGVIVAAVTLCLAGFRFAPDRETVLLGCATGVVLFLYNLGMIRAARSGPYAFQSIVMLFGSIVVCLVFSAVWWGDKMGAAQLVGIGVMLAAFVVLNSGGIDFSGVKKEYFFWVALLFFSNGFYGVLMDAQQRLYPGQRNEMIVITFLSTAMVSLAYLLITRRGQAPAAFRMSPAALGCRGQQRVRRLRRVPPHAPAGLYPQLYPVHHLQRRASGGLRPAVRGGAEGEDDPADGGGNRAVRAQHCAAQYLNTQGTPPGKSRGVFASLSPAPSAARTPAGGPPPCRPGG